LLVAAVVLVDVALAAVLVACVIIILTLQQAERLSLLLPIQLLLEAVVLQELVLLDLLEEQIVESLVVILPHLVLHPQVADLEQQALLSQSQREMLAVLVAVAVMKVALVIVEMLEQEIHHL
jgi:hypothetical protein